MIKIDNVIVLLHQKENLASPNLARILIPKPEVVAVVDELEAVPSLTNGGSTV